MRSRVEGLTRPGTDNARETVDAATPAASATSLIVARFDRFSSEMAMPQGNHIWQTMATICHSCRLVPPPERIVRDSKESNDASNEGHFGHSWRGCRWPSAAGVRWSVEIEFGRWCDECDRYAPGAHPRLPDKQRRQGGLPEGRGQVQQDLPNMKVEPDFVTYATLNEKIST